ncbi:MAG: hypothetical protein LC100_16845 [Chitinophagales bacterium]|nr:hypothetical protein [Chitinophagales bacterium]
MFKKSFIPRWAEKRILSLYEQNIRDVERWRNVVNMSNMLSNGKSEVSETTIKSLRKYSYSIGKVAALEELMDQLFIEYDDHDRVKELYI